MRDATIMAMQKKTAMREGLMLAQFEFLKTRQEAFEVVLKRSSLAQRFKWAIWPELLLMAVDAVQQNLLLKARQEMEAAREKAEVKDKIQIVPAGAAPALSRGLH